jgi:peptide/nickel transport system permease protein
MKALVLKRLASMALVMLGISVLTFAIFFVLPGGDPASRLGGRVTTPQTIADINAQFGLDKSLPEQYVRMMEQIATGDLISYNNRLNVRDQIVSRLAPTFSLAIGAAVLWMILGIVIGVLAAHSAGRWPDRVLMLVTMACVAIPGAGLGVLAKYVLGSQLGAIPLGGYVPIQDDPVQWAWHLIVPWFVLSLLFAGIYGQILRARVLEIDAEDFIRTARAKGLSERTVMSRHTLRLALLPLLTLFGLDFAAVLAGSSIVVDVIFNLQGVGSYAEGAIRTLDLPPIMGVTLYGALFVVICNAVVDLVLLWLDPRARAQAS